MVSSSSRPSSSSSVRSNYDWAADPALVGLAFDPRPVDNTDELAHVTDLLNVVTTCRSGESMLLWTKYRALAALHDQLTPGRGDSDARLVSQYHQVAARYAVTGSIGQATAMRHLSEAVAMVHRLPAVGELLRDGVLAPWQFTRIVTRSDLIDGHGYRYQVDSELARRLARGSWSGRRLDALVDSVIFTHDPDAIRDRHTDAHEQRTVITGSLADGMAEMRVTASVEDTKSAFAAITAIINQVCCPNDPRRRGAQRSDAVIARCHGLRFKCECGDPASCTGQPDTTIMSQPQVIIAMTVIAEQATLSEESASNADGLGYIDGHGVITGDQVRDIAARPNTRTSTLGKTPPPPSAALLAPCLASDPYRFTTAFDAYIRTRDLGCTVPGCDRAARASQLDHCREYNHSNPAAGGRTEPSNVHPLCVFHHQLKTGENGWLDDMTLDDAGRCQYRIRTPEGIWIDGPPLSGIDLLPNLAAITFTQPPTPSTTHQTTTSNKHRRRQQQRENSREP